MALTTSQAAELQSLRAALLSLRSGTMPTSVTYAGERVDFAKLDLADVRDRVIALEALERAPPGARRRAAIRFRL